MTTLRQLDNTEKDMGIFIGDQPVF